MNPTELFYYDESSPSCLRWKVDRYGGSEYTSKAVSAGDVAGSFNGRYWKTEVDGEELRIHRIILMLEGELKPFETVDHMDGDGGNNRRENLRIVSRAVNSRNRVKASSNKSGKTGVFIRTRLDRSDQAIASWYELDGKLRSKSFSFGVYGANAFQLASAYRDAKINELNQAGAGYTERHGTKQGEEDAKS